MTHCHTRTNTTHTHTHMQEETAEEETASHTQNHRDSDTTSKLWMCARTLSHLQSATHTQAYTISLCKADMWSSRESIREKASKVELLNPVKMFL